MQNFRKLAVWQKSHELTLAAYQATENFPKAEMFGLTGQIRRSSASIPANIAEGCGRGSNADLARFLQNAMGSANELEYHLLLARDLKKLAPDVYMRLHRDTDELEKMLSALIRRARG